ncbi:MAG: pyruvate kinase [Candidatus Paceibacterota bacterium]
MQLRKKTKILATIGPVTQDAATLTKLVKAGVNVLRLNFSHGDFAEHQSKVDAARIVEKRVGRPVAILQDLGGPKIRIGEFYKERVQLKKGSEFTLTTKKVTGDETKAYVNYARLPKELSKGDQVLLDDGKKRLEVLRTTKTDVACKVIVGGETKGRRGVNLPGANLSISALTPKDKKDLEFGLANDVDFISLSFVRRPGDVTQLRNILTKRNSRAMIIAKIETQEAIDNIDDIIALADGIMIARGDLAIEVPAEKVPELQKEIIAKCNRFGKPVITATQMLESMIHSPVPTRAEVSDVANAIFDGTDAVMLSEETTLGEYPLEAVQTMTRVALEVEGSYKERYRLADGDPGEISTTDSVTTSVVETSHDIDAALIVAATQTGFSARMISRHKPLSLILALTPDEKTWRQLQLSFGAFPVLVGELESVDDIFGIVRKDALKFKLARKGDKVVVAAGVPFSKKRPETNMMLVEMV